VGAAAGARFIPLAEYFPPDLHPEKPLNERLAVLNTYAESWRPDDRKGPLRQMQAGSPLEVEYTLGYVVREGERLHMATPLCRKVLDMIRELEAGKRAFDLENYAELAETPGAQR